MTLIKEQRIKDAHLIRSERIYTRADEKIYAEEQRHKKAMAAINEARDKQNDASRAMRDEALKKIREASKKKR